MHQNIHKCTCLAMRHTMRGTIWLLERITWVAFTHVPGRAPGGTSGNSCGTGPRRQIMAPNVFLGEVGDVPYVPVPTLKKMCRVNVSQIFLFKYTNMNFMTSILTTSSV